MKVDRFARSTIDYENTKNVLDSLGIKMIFGDMMGFEGVPPLYKDFMMNIFIAMAELEPSKIKEKADASRQLKRELGIYNPVKEPFGYRAITDKSIISSKYIHDGALLPKITAYYEAEPLETAFIKTWFKIYNKYDGNNRSDRLSKLNEKLSSINSLLENITTENFAQRIELIKDLDLSPIKEELLKNNKILNDSNFIEIIGKIKHCTEYLSSYTNVINTLSYCILCKIMPTEPKNKKKAFSYDEANECLVFNANYFKKCVNFDSIIDINTWQTAAKHIYETKNSLNTKKDYLFKGLIKCGKCYHSLSVHEDDEEDLYKCSKGHISLTKDEVIEKITQRLVEDGISEMLKKHLEKEIEKNNKEIAKANEKLSSLQTSLSEDTLKYLDDKDEVIVKSMKSEFEKVNSLKENLYKLNNLQSTYSKMKTLFKTDTIEDKFELANSIKNTFNQDEIKTEMLFRQVIKEVRIKNGSTKCIYNNI